jgi:streptogramin lyase
MVTPRDPEAFRLDVLRRAGRLERRRRRARVLTTVPLVVAAFLLILVVGLARRDPVTSIGPSADTPLPVEVVPTGGHVARSVAVRPDGSLWVLADDGDRRLVGIVESGRWRLVDSLPEGARPEHVVSTVSGDAWVTDPAGARVLRVRADGGLSAYSLPGSPGATATLGADRRLWFALPETDELGAVDDAGRVQRFPVPRGRKPSLVALAPNGSVAYASEATHFLGTVAPDGSVVEYALADPSSRAVALLGGPGPALWFASSTEEGVRLGRVSGSGTLVDAGSIGDRAPTALGLGPDGRLWFSDHRTDVVRQRSLTRLTERALERALDAAAWALAPDGSMWAADPGGPGLVRIGPD